MAASTKLRLLADENDLQAVRTDPSGFLYAVLQVLRVGEDYAEADFQALIERGRTYALEQGGLGRSAVPVPVPARARAARAVPDPPTRIRAQRAPKKRITPSGEVSYAGTEAEAEAVAEAQRLREQGVGPVEFEEEAEEQGLEVEDNRITLTNDQLQRLMATVAQKAVARSQTPQPAETVDVEVDDLEEDDPEEDDGASAHEAATGTPDVDTQPLTDATEESDRGRDDSGRFVTKPKGK